MAKHQLPQKLLIFWTIKMSRKPSAHLLSGEQRWAGFTARGLLGWSSNSDAPQYVQRLQWGHVRTHPAFVPAEPSTGWLQTPSMSMTAVKLFSTWTHTRAEQFCVHSYILSTVSNGNTQIMYLQKNHWIIQPTMINDLRGARPCVRSKIQGWV